MPPKRKATEEEEEDVRILEIKKTKQSPYPNDPKSAQQGNGFPYQISVTLHPKFDVFPATLRAGLQKACRATLYRRQQTLRSSTTPRISQRETYKLIKGQRIRSISLTFTQELLQSNIADLDMANVTLLEHLLAEKQLDLPNEPRSFLCTQKREGLRNPEFLELHSTRPGEMAWGVDSDRCLSFYYTQVEENRLREEVWYVMKEGIKVENGV